MFLKKERKIFLISIFSIMFVILFSYVTVASQEIGENNIKRILMFNSLVELDIEDHTKLYDPIFPGSEPETLNMTVRFRLDIERQSMVRFLLNTKIGRWILFRDSGELPQAEINITLNKVPSWCNIDILPNPVYLTISNEFQEEQVLLSLSVTEDAPAFEISSFNIEAVFDSKENWGIGSSGSATYLLSFTPGNTPNISVSCANSSYKIAPLNTTTIPFNISNQGTSTTTVDITMVAPPKNWTIVVNSPITLTAGETQQVPLVVTPSNNFQNTTLQIRCTPTIVTSMSNIDETLLKGDPLFLDISITNDGSLKEKNVTPGFEILIVLLALSFLFFKRKIQ